jgi:hypothetical protein
VADDRKPGRDRGCCGDVDEVGREANARPEQQLPEWLEEEPYPGWLAGIDTDEEATS